MDQFKKAYLILGVFAVTNIIPDFNGCIKRGLEIVIKPVFLPIPRASF